MASEEHLELLDIVILMIRLENYGFRGTLLEILRKYPNDRYQFFWKRNQSHKPCVKTRSGQCTRFLLFSRRFDK